MSHSSRFQSSGEAASKRTPKPVFGFQAVADDLLRLVAMGYVEECEALVETSTGRQYVDRLYVRRGITQAGREALENASWPRDRAAASWTG